MSLCAIGVVLCQRLSLVAKSALRELVNALGARIRETFARGVEVGATIAHRTSSTTAEPLDIEDRASIAIPSGTECLIQFATTLASR